MTSNCASATRRFDIPDGLRLPVLHQPQNQHRAAANLAVEQQWQSSEPVPYRRPKTALNIIQVSNQPSNQRRQRRSFSQMEGREGVSRPANEAQKQGSELTHLSCSPSALDMGRQDVSSMARGRREAGVGRTLLPLSMPPSSLETVPGAKLSSRPVSSKDPGAFITLRLAVMGRPVGIQTQGCGGKQVYC